MLRSWVAFDADGFPVAFADAVHVPRWEFEYDYPDRDIREVEGKERAALLALHAAGPRPSVVAVDPPPIATLFEHEPGDFLPYGGTSGWSGTETSRERAEVMDGDGRIKARDVRTFELVTAASSEGLTWKEAADLTGMHHGEMTGSLCRLHMAGHIARITETRRRSQVYVAPQYVGDRSLSPYRPNASKKMLLELCDDLDERLGNGDVQGARRAIAEVRHKFSHFTEAKP